MKQQILLANSIAKLTEEDQDQFLTLVKNYVPQGKQKTAVIRASRKPIPPVHELFCLIENSVNKDARFQTKNSKNISKVGKKIMNVLDNSNYARAIVCISRKEDKVIKLCKELGIILDTADQAKIIFNENYIIQLNLLDSKVVSVKIESVVMQKNLVL